MIELVRDLYSDYGKYINQYRSFPHILDGAKIVERRLLYSLHLLTRNGLAKSAEVVGYTIGNFHPHGDCLAADTKINLLDGTTPTIKELYDSYKDEVFWVYSMDENGDVVPGKAHSPRIGQRTTTKYNITLDNGEIIECTGNHPFMLKDLSYCAAKDLKVGMSLSPLYISQDDGYTYFNTAKYEKGKYSKKTSVMVCEYFYPDFKSSTDYHCHHIDKCRNNDTPSNVIPLSSSDHSKLHLQSEEVRSKALLNFREFWNDYDRNRSTRKLLSDIQKELWQSDEYREKQSSSHIEAYATNADYRNSSNKGLEIGRQKMFNENGEFREKIKTKNSKLITKINKRLPAIKATRLVRDILDDGLLPTPSLYECYRQRDKYYNYPLLANLLDKEYFSDFNELIESAKVYNHKVVNIEVIELDESEEFYDITVEKYHNFALTAGVFVHNSSCYDSLVGLVRNGFAIGQGNWGINVGVQDEPAAAMRYTEVRAHKDILKMAFEYINEVPFSALELKDEPVFMPTQFPLCLLPKETHCQGIGFGYRTNIPSYDKKDLLKRLKWILDGKKGKGPVIKPMTNCKLEATEADYLEILTTGKGKLKYIPIVKKEDNKTALVLAIPPSKSFAWGMKGFEKEINQEKSLGWQDDSKDSTKVRFKIMKARLLKIDKLIKKLERRFTTTITFECNMCDIQGKVVTLSVDQMLFNIYKVYSKVVKTKMRKDIAALDKSIEELNLIAKMKPLLSDQLKKNPDDVDAAVDMISKSLEQTSKTIKDIFEKYNIRRIFKIKTDVADLKKQKSELEDTLNNHFTEYVWSKYTS